MGSSESSHRSFYKGGRVNVPNWIRAHQAHKELEDFFARGADGPSSPMSSVNASNIEELLQASYVSGGIATSMNKTGCQNLARMLSDGKLGQKSRHLPGVPNKETPIKQAAKQVMDFKRQ
jgi:hypothetical protein